MKGNIKRIGLVLLTLLTLSLGTLVVNAETKDSDFVIENGVLKQYKGNDDTVYIPEGVTKITSDRKSTRLNSSHITRSRMPSSA